MLETVFFPKGLGMDYAAPVVENDDGTVTVAEFAFTLEGVVYEIAGGTFTLAKGDIVYITMKGLMQCKGADEETKTAAEYPDDSVKFPNNSVHWLLTKLDDTKVRVLEVG